MIGGLDAILPVRHGPGRESCLTAYALNAA